MGFIFVFAGFSSTQTPVSFIDILYPYEKQDRQAQKIILFTLPIILLTVHFFLSVSAIQNVVDSYIMFH